MVSGSFPFARHYLGNRCFSLFLRVLRWFSSPSSLTYTMNSYTHDDSSVAGFPHSDICGSILICSSPQLFAACHVLLRLPVPRHSPCALISLTFSLLRLFFALPSLLAYAIFNEQNNVQKNREKEDQKVLHRKEVIQPHLPIRLPCYDFTPIICPTFGSALPEVKLLTSGVTDSHGVTGGVYKARERIHGSMLTCHY